MEKKVYSVSSITKYIFLKFDYDSNLKNVSIKGEVDSLKKHKEILYFNIKDDNSYIACRADIRRIKNAEHLKNGDIIIIIGDVNVYQKKTEINFWIKKIEENLEGELQKKKEAIINEFRLKGYLNKKKLIPKYPKSIAVITSKDGDVKEDIRDQINRKAPYITLTLYDTIIQGEAAKESIIKKLKKADNQGYDILVLGRGGGSEYDLDVFNDKDLGECIACLKTPIITCIGHTVNNTIADMVSDYKASTPTDAGAEIVKYLNKERLTEDLKYYKNRMTERINTLIDKYILKTNNLKQRLKSLNKDYILENKLKQLKVNKKLITNQMKGIYTKNNKSLINLKIKLKETMKSLFNIYNIRLSKLSDKLSLLSPDNTLSRGYAYILNDNNIVLDSINKIKIEDKINIKLKDGKLKVKVEEVKANEE